MKTIADAARRIAAADGYRSVTLGHVVRAALVLGHGNPARPLTRALRRQRALGCMPTDAEWAAAIDAMLRGGNLYVGLGGQYVYHEPWRTSVRATV